MLKRRLSKAGNAWHTLLIVLVLFGVYLAQSPAAAQMLVMSSNYLSASTSISDTAEAGTFNDSLALLEPGAPVINMQPQAKKFVGPYLRKNDDHLERIQKRSSTIFQTIEVVFEKHGLPEELKYLAVVESNLKTTAVSRVGAVGLWQLMPETARDYGLKITRKTDERRNAYKSTVAAAKYIKGLYREFGDWLLVVAAYNSGSGTVARAMKKAGSRNYWAMRRFLPAETRGHVEHFISTHYFFEGRGSEVTLTRAELANHRRAVSDYLSKRACDAEQLAAQFAVAAAAAATATANGSALNVSDK